MGIGMVVGNQEADLLDLILTEAAHRPHDLLGLVGTVQLLMLPVVAAVLALADVDADVMEDCSFLKDGHVMGGKALESPDCRGEVVHFHEVLDPARVAPVVDDHRFHQSRQTNIHGSVVPHSTSELHAFFSKNVDTAHLSSHQYPGPPRPRW